MRIIGRDFSNGGVTGEYWDVDDGLFDEYCHVILHINLGIYLPSFSEIPMRINPAEPDCVMSKMSRSELEDRRIKLHEKMYQQATGEKYHGFGRHDEGATRTFLNSMEYYTYQAMKTKWKWLWENLKD